MATQVSNCTYSRSITVSAACVLAATCFSAQRLCEFAPSFLYRNRPKFCVEKDFKVTVNRLLMNIL